MFAVVFPLAPLFAYINNLWEFRLDLSQLVKTRRPQVRYVANRRRPFGIIACFASSFPCYGTAVPLL